MAAQPKKRKRSMAETLSRDASLVDCLYLVSNGVPFDVAFSLDADERLAWVVIFGELKGRVFNWITHEWEPVRS